MEVGLGFRVDLVMLLIQRCELARHCLPGSGRGCGL